MEIPEGCAPVARSTPPEPRPIFHFALRALYQIYDRRIHETEYPPQTTRGGGRGTSS